MKFYADTFRAIRKQKKITMTEVAQKADITRKTLGIWENSTRIPSEMKVRSLAHILDISVDKISDLEPEHPVSKGNFSEVIGSWLSLADTTEKQRIQQENNLVNQIKYQQKELRQATVVIKALLASMESIFYVKDSNLLYITANNAFLKNLSLSPAYQVLGKKDSDFYPLREAQSNHQQDYEVLISGRPILNTEEYIPGSRKKKWGLISKIPIFDSEGKIAGLVGNFLDITDRRKEEELRELLAGNIDSMTEAISVVDLKHGKYLYFNSAKETVFGYSSEEFYNGGPDFWFNKCVHPDDKPEQLKYRKNNNWPKVRNYRIVKSDGEVRWVETHYTFPKKKFFGRECAVTLTIDITERIKAEEINKLLELSLSKSSHVVWLLEPQPSLKTIYVSDSVSEMYGYDAEIFKKNGSEFWLKCIHPDDRKKFGDDWLKARGDGIETFQYRIIRPDGKICRLKSVFFSSTKGKCVAYIERNITSEKKNVLASVKTEMIKVLKDNGFSSDVIADTYRLSIDEVDSI